MKTSKHANLSSHKPQLVLHPHPPPSSSTFILHLHPSHFILHTSSFTLHPSHFILFFFGGRNRRSFSCRRFRSAPPALGGPAGHLLIGRERALPACRVRHPAEPLVPGRMSGNAPKMGALPMNVTHISPPGAAAPKKSGAYGDVPREIVWGAHSPSSSIIRAGVGLELYA